MEKSFSGKEISTRLAQGDQAMFLYLYDTYHHAIYLNVRKLINDSTEIEDIVQEVFLRLWNKRAEIDPKCSIAGWLYKVSFNMCMDHLRFRMRRLASTGLVAEEIADLAAEGGEESRWHLLEEAIEHLSPQKRRVFQLCKIEGKSYEEAAMQLGISKFTINEYLKDGMTFIRGYVQDRISVYSVAGVILFLVALSRIS